MYTIIFQRSDKRIATFGVINVKVGVLTGKGKDRRLLILRILATRGPLSLTELAKEIEDYEKRRKGSYRSIRGRLGKKDGPLRNLQLKEYIYGKKFNGTYERSKVDITYKGFYALFSMIKKEERYELCSKLTITKDILYRIKNPMIKYYIVGFQQDLDYYYLYMKKLLPIKPIIEAWMMKTENEYLNLDLDPINNEIIIQDFIESAEKILNIIFLLMRIDGVAGYYFEDDFDMILTRTINWINSHDNMKKLHTMLANNNLSNRKTLTKFEKKIIEKLHNWQVTKLEAETMGIRM